MYYLVQCNQQIFIFWGYLMVQSKSTQIKFTVDEEQYSKLEKLSNDRYLSVPQFCKLTALQVRVAPARPIEIKGQLDDEDKVFLQEVIRRYDKNRQYFQFDKGFNERLFHFASKQLGL